MSDGGSPLFSYEELFDRATRAVTDEELDQCLADIDRLLASSTSPADRGRLLMCRARVRSNQWHTDAVFEDARDAMRLFEMAGEGDLVVDAASWAAAHASRMGELSVAAELATRALLGLEIVDDERLRMEIPNRLGIFCVSFLDYDRAIEQFEDSLAAAERLGDQEKIGRQLHNLADCLLLMVRQKRVANAGDGAEELARAEDVVAEMLARATPEFLRRAGGYRLQAEVLCESGRPEEGLAMIEAHRDQVDGIVSTAQRAAVAWIEARCLRLAGQPEKAVERASSAVEMALDSSDDHELMVALEELSACQEAAGDLRGALETSRLVKARIWTIHRRETRQLVQEVWGRADLIRDQATLQTQAAEARRRANEDALTGIGNRRVLESYLDREAYERRPLALVVIDVDHFKVINDTLGHPVGDSVLRRIGQLLRDEVRTGQVAVRYGGDEFVLGVIGVELEAAVGLAERLRHRIEGLDWSALATGLHVTASLGVASGVTDGWRETFSAADAALYAAKRAGRNTVVAGGEPAARGAEPDDASPPQRAVGD
jgi:diguanylate cyclase (GGDEF)-like protein